MNSTRNLWVAVVVLAIIAVGGYLFPQASKLLGRVGTAFPNGICVGSNCAVSTAGSFRIGSSGTEVAGHQYGTCAASFASADLAATTSAIGICLDSTFTTSDKVLATQRFTGATTGLPSFGLFPVLQIIATTSGQFGVQVTNYTGAASTSINAIYRTYSYQLER